MAGGSICAGIAGSRGGRPRKKKTLSRLGGMTRGFTDDFFFIFYDGRWFKGAVLFIHPCNPVCFILIAANGIYDKS
jgi:hypothetical protein